MRLGTKDARWINFSGQKKILFGLPLLPCLNCRRASVLDCCQHTNGSPHRLRTAQHLDPSRTFPSCGVPNNMSTNLTGRVCTPPPLMSGKQSGRAGASFTHNDIHGVSYHCGSRSLLWSQNMSLRFGCSFFRVYH